MIIITENDKIIEILPNTKNFKDRTIKKDATNFEEWWDYHRFIIEDWPNLLKRVGAESQVHVSEGDTP